MTIAPKEPPGDAPSQDPLAPFSPAVRAWFESSFAAPTQAQAEGWAAISSGAHTLIHAPTGSGKTLAAFLWTLDRLATTPPRPAPTKANPGTVRVLYISPLKALTYDVERNLRPGSPWPRPAWASPPRTSRSPAGPATRPPRTGATSPAARPTS